jgi:N,N-dimethylformamidase
MTYFTAGNNGAVFSTGSIAWTSALPSNGYVNDISRITKNILDAFSTPGKLPGGEWTEDEKSWR